MVEGKIAALKQTSLDKEYVEQCCSHLGSLSSEEILELVFDASNSRPIMPHAKAIGELGERMLSDSMNGQAAEALVALNLAASSEEKWLSGPAQGILDRYYNRKFSGKLKQIENKTLADLIEVGKDVHSSGQLATLMDHVAKRALTRGFSRKESRRIGKVALGLLERSEENVVFEAAFVLKELKSPCTYPGIIEKLKKKPSPYSTETRRMLRAAAENIAMEVTGDVFSMTADYRKGDWNRLLFQRMRKHREMLKRLEGGPRGKRGLQKR
ncbi:hypothetical protein GF412_04095 [Candidatus Micrarchaeota archaeon]|nr:hypothetical protein [Candidatus Micrarchaeota archaeon]MBD3418131.1 hypothetical protein [Candidatus Micrarchaeota archaeon]